MANWFAFCQIGVLTILFNLKYLFLKYNLKARPYYHLTRSNDHLCNFYAVSRNFSFSPTMHKRLFSTIKCCHDAKQATKVRCTIIEFFMYYNLGHMQPRSSAARKLEYAFVHCFQNGGSSDVKNFEDPIQNLNRSKRHWN